MRKTNYFNLIRETEEYKSLMKLGVPLDDIMFYFNHVAIYSMRNDYKHRKRYWRINDFITCCPCARGSSLRFREPEMAN